MDLLSAGQRASIRASLQDVTDTFFKTPVTYHLKGESIDRFNEDRIRSTTTDFNLLCLVEYDKETLSDIDKMAEGAKAFGIADISVAMSDAKVLGFADSTGKCVGNENQDYLTINGIYYRVIQIAYDGPLDQENILIYIKAEKVERNA